MGWLNHPGYTWVSEENLPFKIELALGLGRDALGLASSSEGLPIRLRT